MLTLGIETSCDETSASIVKDARAVLSNQVASSLAQHVPFGGIIPEIASRAQLEYICPVVDSALKKAGVRSDDIDLIAVTKGPGLIGSLLVGVSFAEALGSAWKTPVLGVDHLKGHLYAAFLNNNISFPFTGLVVSGGHTILYNVKGLMHEEMTGATRDDAAGEAFDKVAKILGLSYPGGPVIERLARQGDRKAFSFRCDCGTGLDFSFSGIKTAVMYKVMKLKKIYGKLNLNTVCDLCASFQHAVVSDLVQKSVRAALKAGSKMLVVGGGVAFNGYLRQELAKSARANNIKLFIAARDYCLDNAAMIAGLACRLYKSGRQRAFKKVELLLS